MLEKINETTEFLISKGFVNPDAGIILGTGLGGLTAKMADCIEIDYPDIPNFPITTVEGHAGKLIYGDLGKKKIVAMKGRFHYYEGYTMQEITFPVGVMKFLGIKVLILSNASGGVNPDFEIGDLMVVEDHINLMKSNPLIGKNEDEIGIRFPDMSRAYDPDMIRMAFKIAEKHGIKLQKGVYAAVSGPTFETPAEYRYIRIIGADAVGMSTVPEVIAARHMGLRCFAFSVISDLGVHGKIVEITHHDVIMAASNAEPKMTKIIKEMIAGI